jgi:vitamin B12 transporter
MSRPRLPRSWGLPAATIALALLWALPCSGAEAQESPSAGVLEIPLTVTATRLPMPTSEVGSSVTVITGQEIQQGQERTLPDVLRDVSGLNVVQLGGPGGLTSVFIRGTNSNHTKVFIAGIDAGDPAPRSPGAFGCSTAKASSS